MIKEFKIGNIEFKFVFRHRFEKDRKKDFFDFEWKSWTIGLWYKNYQVVGKKHYRVVSEWSKNTITIHQIGFHLLWCKMWIEVGKEALHFGNDDD
jgi:hypothetical protein